MRTFTAFVLTASLLASASLLQAQAPASSSETIAEKSDLQWLSLIDAGSYDSAWKSAAQAMQKGAPERTFAQAVRQSRTPLGTLTSRTLKDAKSTTSLPGVPDGHYVVVEYDSAFANKAAAIETVITTQEPDGGWRVAGYFIR